MVYSHLARAPLVRNLSFWSQVARPSSPLLPSLLRDGLFPSLGLFVLRGTVVPAACAVPLSGIASTALHLFAFQLGLLSTALVLATVAHVCIIWPDAHRSARYTGSICAIGNLLLIPSVSESAVALLNCVSVRLPPAGRASLDGVAAVTLSTGASSSVLTSTAYIASLQTEFLLFANPRHICFSGSHLNVGLVAVAALALCIVSLPTVLCVVLLRDPRLGRFRGMFPPPVSKHRGKPEASALVQPAGPLAPIARPSPPVDGISSSAAATATASSTHDTAISVTPLAKRSPAILANTDTPPDPVVVAILGPYAPRAWPLAILDPFAAIVLGALEGFYLHPVDLSGVLIKACVGATVVVSLFVIVVVIRPFAQGHEWMAPVRAALLVLALVCILNNLGAGLVQIGYADGGPWQDVGTGVVYSSASVAAVIMVGCWEWHVLCTSASIVTEGVEPLGASSPAAVANAPLDFVVAPPSAQSVAPATTADLVSSLPAVTAPVEATPRPSHAAASSDSRRGIASGPILASSPREALGDSIPAAAVRPASPVAPSSRAASSARHAPPLRPGGPESFAVPSVVPAEGGANSSRGLPPRRGMSVRQLSIQTAAAVPPPSTRASLERSPGFHAAPAQLDAPPSPLPPRLEAPPVHAATTTVASAQPRPPTRDIPAAAEVSQAVTAAAEPPAADSALGGSSRAPSTSVPRGPDASAHHDQQRRSSDGKDAGPVPSARRIPPCLSIPPAASRVVPVPDVGPAAPVPVPSAAGQLPEPRASEDNDPAPTRGAAGSVAEESWALGDESSDSQAGGRATNGRATRVPGGGGAGGASREPAAVSHNVAPPPLSLGHSRRSRDWLAAVSSHGPAPSRQPISASTRSFFEPGTGAPQAAVAEPYKSSQTAREEEERDRRRPDRRLLPGEAPPAPTPSSPSSPHLGSPSRLPGGVPAHAAHESGRGDATSPIESRQPRGVIAVAPAPDRARSPLTITEQQALLSPTRRGAPPAGDDVVAYATTARAATLGQQQLVPPLPGGSAAALPAAASVPQRPTVLPPRAAASKPELPFFILPPPERPAAVGAADPPVSSRTSGRAAPVWAAAAAALPPGLSLHSREPGRGGPASWQQQQPTPRPADAGPISRAASWGALQQPREWAGRPAEGIEGPSATSTLAATARSTLSPPLQLLQTRSFSGRKDAVPRAEPPTSARGHAATGGTRWGFGPQGSGGAGGGAPPTSRPNDVPGLLGAPQQVPSSPRDPVIPTPRLAAAVQSPRLLRQLQMQRAAGPPSSQQY